MRSLKHLSALVAVTFAVLPAGSVWADDNLPEAQQQGNVPYISGGIGREESNALESIQHNYNLRIMSADRTGHYSGDTRIIVSDRQQHVLLDTRGGPLFYANLPDGHYTVEGYEEGHSKKQSVVIAGRKPVHVQFSWQQDFSDITNY